MKNYLIGLVTALGLTGCVALPNIDYSQQKVERFNPVKNWISVDSASVKDIPNGNEIFKLKGERSLCVQISRRMGINKSKFSYTTVD